MVGNSNSLATSCMLVCVHLSPDGRCSSSGSLLCSWWRFHLDVARVQFAPLYFPQEDNKLLVCSFPSAFVCLHKVADRLKLVEYLCRGNTLHYLIHGCHHKHPMDGLRLVFPPAATAILAVPVCSILLQLNDYSKLVLN